MNENFIYKRDNHNVFTISNLLRQISDWTAKYKKLPLKIFLPSEEYHFLTYIIETSGYSRKLIKYYKDYYVLWGFYNIYPNFEKVEGYFAI